MSTATKASVVVAALALTLGAGSASLPTTVLPAGTATSVSAAFAADESGRQSLLAAIGQANTTHAAAVARVRADRAAALAVPRADRKAALAAAQSRAERRQAKLAYRATVAPVKQGYADARADAAAVRRAAIDAAVAHYLAAAGGGSPAAVAYLVAVTNAQATLELALRSSRQTYTTDTYDERALLGVGMEQASTRADRRHVWDGFMSGTHPERVARAVAVAGARATYRSAITQARTSYKATTGTRVPSAKALLAR